MLRGRLLLPLLAAAALTGCGGHSFHGPTLLDVCRNVVPGAEPMWLETSDHVRLYAVEDEVKGDATVVLAHESGDIGLCGWLPTIRWFAAHGVSTIAFNFRGVYPSQRAPSNYGADLDAAMGIAEGWDVFAMGASMGGAAVLAHHWSSKGPPTGLISLSGEPDLLGAAANVPHITLPLLVVASRDDGYLTGAAARKLVARAGSRDKRAVVYPGTHHGWDILDELPQARQLVLRWIKQRTR